MLPRFTRTTHEGGALDVLRSTLARAPCRRSTVGVVSCFFFPVDSNRDTMSLFVSFSLENCRSQLRYESVYLPPPSFFLGASPTPSVATMNQKQEQQQQSSASVQPQQQQQQQAAPMRRQQRRRGLWPNAAGGLAPLVPSLVNPLSDFEYDMNRLMNGESAHEWQSRCSFCPDLLRGLNPSIHVCLKCRCVFFNSR